MSLAPNDPRHGTRGGYKDHKCRCDQCRAAANAYQRERQRRHNGLPPGDPRHGTLNGYVNCRCRCPECGQTHADYQRDYYQRERRNRRAS